MTSARAKGLQFVREVRDILSEAGHIVDGPFSKSRFFDGKMMALHVDIFGVFDLVSYKNGIYYFHQVSVINRKADKIKAIQAADLRGYVWCRDKIKNKVSWRIFEVNLAYVKDVNGIESI